MKMVESEFLAPNHGGEISVAEARFGVPENEWLDLSTGINPNPYSDFELSSAALSDLPTGSALTGLLEAARKAYTIPNEAALCAAPGTQAFLQILPDLVVSKGPVAVVSPTYSEHAHLWRVSGYPVLEVDDVKSVGDAVVVIVVNPNNPDGRKCDVETLDALRRKLDRSGGLLIVDEAFADVTPEISMTPHAGSEGLLVLRSFGKFFGLAGLRLGFAVGPEMLINRLVARLGPWAVSGPAIEIGTKA
ncbi:MAG: aminotransferase class I/II-fold pyridoxal phosphate-dependent enzyme, partial [Alphaproteobacteria bacterium]|nr:aminotransferase class I/II-fold pyridoxal phosphate-dependent enzyme [Alphaproteobacteria bacterium]